MNIPFSKASIKGNKPRYFDEVLKSGAQKKNSNVSKFDEFFAQSIGAQNKCAVKSCNTALHHAVEVVGIQHGDKVLVPTLTFSASIDVLLEIGADPVFIDVEGITDLVSPKILNKALKDHPDVKAIILVNFDEQAKQMKVAGGEGILDLCQKYNVKIIEETAHYFPNKLGNQFVGSTFGNITHLLL